jgi:hypothetical protein
MVAVVSGGRTIAAIEEEVSTRRGHRLICHTDKDVDRERTQPGDLLGHRVAGLTAKTEAALLRSSRRRDDGV